MGADEQGEPVRTLVGDFDAADELLWAAQSGELAELGAVVVRRSGRIGPLIELIRARQRWPAAFGSVNLEAPFARTVEAGLARGEINGSARGSRAGVFPLSKLGADGERTDAWILWAAQADHAATAVGFPDLVAAEILGALGELQDNVFRHSEAPRSGIVAFAAMPGHLEVVVSDAGIGVLASLRQHPDYAALEDAGTALKVAVADGESRFGRGSGCGFGMGQMFRALANHDGDLRFRSGDHALEVRGHSPSLQGRVELGHKAGLPGLTVSVLCRATSDHGRTL